MIWAFAFSCTPSPPFEASVVSADAIASMPPQRRWRLIVDVDNTAAEPRWLVHPLRIEDGLGPFAVEQVRVEVADDEVRYRLDGPGSTGWEAMEVPPGRHRRVLVVESHVAKGSTDVPLALVTDIGLPGGASLDQIVATDLVGTWTPPSGGDATLAGDAIRTVGW